MRWLSRLWNFIRICFKMIIYDAFEPIFILLWLQIKLQVYCIVWAIEQLIQGFIDILYRFPRYIVRKMYRDGTLVTSCIIIICAIIHFSNIDDKYLIIGLHKFQDSLELSDFISLIGANFAHANMSHLIGNMFFFSVIGPLVERKLGSIKYIILLAVSASTGTIFYFITNPNGRALGASIMLFGVIGTYFAKYIRKPIYWILALAVVAEFWTQLYDNQFTASNIGYMAHMGGFIGGVVTFLCLENAKLRQLLKRSRVRRFSIKDML